MFTLEIPMIPPSPNEIKRKYRHPKVYMNLRKTWEQSIFISTGSASRAQEIKQIAQETPCMIVRIRIHHRGSYDPDNLTGSVKVILDAMRNIGFLRNDRAKDIQLDVQQFANSLGHTTISMAPSEN